MTAHLKTPLSSSWSLQTTPHWSASFRSVTSLLTGGYRRQEVKELRLRSWLSGAVLTTWSVTLETVEMIVDFRRNLTAPPPTHHHEQHCDCSGVIQIPEHQNFSGPEVRQSHWVHCEKGPAEAVLLSPAEEVQPATGVVDTVLLCTSKTVWFSSATKSDLRRLRRVVRTAERIIGTTLPTLQVLYSSRMSKGAGEITLDPSQPAHSLFELLPSGRCYRALSTRMTRHRNSFFPRAIHLMNTWH